MRTTLALPLTILLLALSYPAAAQEPPATNLTHPGGGYHPTWSPDGTQIAFASDRDGGGIFVIPATGGTAEKVTNPTSPEYYSYYDPAWSPNGDEIAYVREYHGFPYDTWGISAIPAQGGGSRGLTGGIAVSRYPSWSPDGTQIAFFSDRSTPGDIYVMAATGEPPAATRLTIPPGGSTRGSDNPAWSPDGTQIAFGSNRIDGNRDIWVMPATGEPPATRLTDYPSFENFPVWSPDGTQIAFTSDILGNYDIFMMPATGGAPTQLTFHTASDLHPAWSPDGTRIAFQSNRDGDDEVWVMDLSALAVGPATVAPANVRLAVSPNPFRNATTIHLAGMEGLTTLRIMDVTGRLVREIGVTAGPSSGAAQSVVWDGRDSSGLAVARGVYYLLSLEDGNRRQSGRVVRVR